MKYILIGTLSLAFLDYSVSLSMPQDVVLEDKDSQCDAYCFKVLKPMLDHISVMQQHWEVCDASKLANTSARLDNIEKLVMSHAGKDVSLAEAIEDTKRKLLAQQKLIEKQKNPLGKPFKKIGSKYYYIEEKQKLNWFAATHKCHELGAHLISIDDQRELDAIHGNLNTEFSYWIDVNSLSEEGIYLSLTTGRRAKFLKWSKGEPNNAAKIEHCVYIFGSQSQMNDFKCDASDYFICESYDESDE